MGNTGPDYEDDRVEKTDTGELGFYGHSTKFEHIEFWGPKIVEDCERTVSRLGLVRPRPPGTN